MFSVLHFTWRTDFIEDTTLPQLYKCATCNRTLLVQIFNKLEVSRLDSTLSVFIIIRTIHTLSAMTLWNWWWLMWITGCRLGPLSLIQVMTQWSITGSRVRVWIIRIYWAHWPHLDLLLLHQFWSSFSMVPRAWAAQQMNGSWCVLLWKMCWFLDGVSCCCLNFVPPSSWIWVVGISVWSQKIYGPQLLILKPF